MVEMIVGTYGLLCWLVFKKFKLVPITTYTICTALLGGFIILGLLYVTLSVFHPVSHDGRMYAPIVQIVPQVRGLVIEVPVTANQQIKKGDVLFRIDAKPYQIEVDRLRAVLAAKNAKFAQLAEQLAQAEAATRQARANLIVSESTNDRQLRESYEQTKSQVTDAKDKFKFAQAQYDRAKELRATGAMAQAEYDRTETAYLAQKSTVTDAESNERIAAEKLKSGSASLEAARQELARLEAAERAVHIQVQAQTDGVNPDVRETMALLEKARWDLEQTSVRAPTDGYVPQVILRPGMMAVPLPLKPLMVFVADEEPYLIATYAQKVISDIKPGMHGEAVFKQYPGRTFKVKVRRVLTAVREGELDAGGQLLNATSEYAHGYIPIIFDYDEDVSGLNLPIGSQASIAVYTDRFHPLSFLRKIILRIHSWENFVF